MFIDVELDNSVHFEKCLDVVPNVVLCAEEGVSRCFPPAASECCPLNLVPTTSVIAGGAWAFPSSSTCSRFQCDYCLCCRQSCSTSNKMYCTMASCRRPFLDQITGWPTRTHRSSNAASSWVQCSMTSCRRLKSDQSLDPRFAALDVLSIKLDTVHRDFMSTIQILIIVWTKA